MEKSAAEAVLNEDEDGDEQGNSANVVALLQTACGEQASPQCCLVPTSPGQCKNQSGIKIIGRENTCVPDTVTVIRHDAGILDCGSIPLVDAIVEN